MIPADQLSTSTQPQPPPDATIRRLSVPERFAECRALALSPEPLTDAHIAERRRLIAREYARAAERRKSHPQQPLPGVA